MVKFRQTIWRVGAKTLLLQETHCGQIRSVMKMLTTFLLMALAVYTGSAQTVEPNSVANNGDTTTVEAAADTLVQAAPRSSYEPLVLPVYAPVAGLHSPWHYGLRGYGLHGFSPWSNWGVWQLREGFNAQVGMNVSTAFGKYAPNGAGFGQNIALAYAKTLSPRWAVAVAAYGSNMDWGNWNRKEFGVSAVVRYKANDWLNLYGYASKNICEKGAFSPFDYGLSPYYALGHPYYPMGNPGTRVGATAEFKLSERAFISVSFDYVKYDAPEDIAPLMKRPTYQRENTFIRR